MSDIRDTKLRRLDLTSLLVFDRLMVLRKATLVASELGLTPPGISHVLRRLREVFGDELFLRRPHGLEPTAFAKALEPRVRRAIEELRDGLSDTEAFDPRDAEATLRIGAFDYELATLAPRLIGIIAARAPRVRLVLRAIGGKPALDAVAAGELDFAIGYFWDVSESTPARKLYTETYAVIARKGDPLAGKKLTLPRYCAAPHVLVSPSGELTGIVDVALERLGKTRRVIASVPLFLPAFAVVQETGALATVPKRLAVTFARSFALEVIDLPLEVRSFDVSVARHRRDARNAMHNWIEGVIHELVSAPTAA
jgi:DNA-binding transcriptional LysR family regulator